MKVKDGYTNEKIIEMCKGVYWRHDLELGDVKITGMDRGQTWRSSILPKRYDGKAVIDIGCADGFYSFYAEQNGAKSVFAFDTVDWPAHKIAAEVLVNNVSFAQMSIYDLHTLISDKFDVAIFMGVIYHLKHPLLGIEQVVNIMNSGGEVYLESLVQVRKDNEGTWMEFLEDNRVNNDPTNWWNPTIDCVLAMMRVAGLTEVRLIDNKYYSNRAFFYGKKQ